jgi:hypothetical protein
VFYVAIYAVEIGVHSPWFQTGWPDMRGLNFEQMIGISSGSSTTLSQITKMLTGQPALQMMKKRR